MRDEKKFEGLTTNVEPITTQPKHVCRKRKSKQASEWQQSAIAVLHARTKEKNKSASAAVMNGVEQQDSASRPFRCTSTALRRRRRAAGTGPVGIGPGRTWAARRGGRRRRIPSRREQRGRRRRGALLTAAERHHPSESAALPFLHRRRRRFFGLLVSAGSIRGGRTKMEETVSTRKTRRE